MIKFDPVCLDEFENVLRRYPTSKIVISSSWREMYSLQTISSLFSPDIAIRVIGVIPYLHPIVIEKNKYIRHQGVLEFLRQNNEKIPIGWPLMTLLISMNQVVQLLLPMPIMALIIILPEYSIAIWPRLVKK
jgi:hypothetical protein